MIKFQGPYHISQLKNLGLEKQRGVYIWGFAFRFQDGKCHSPVNLNKETILSTIGNSEISFPSNIKFIPYYVGEGKLYDRINKHSNFKARHSAKYTRFSMPYMNEFYKGNGFPIHLGRPKKVDRANQVVSYLKGNPGSLDYYNSDIVLSSIYTDASLTPEGSKSIDWPINKQTMSGGTPMQDTLDKIVSSFNNFFFCYAPIENESNLRHAEASTFWALKGFTISQINKKYTPTNINIDGYWSNLFRHPSGTPSSPNFHGY